MQIHLFDHSSPPVFNLRKELGGIRQPNNGQWEIYFVAYSSGTQDLEILAKGQANMERNGHWMRVWDKIEAES